MRLFVHELRYELRLYSRSRELAFFTFLFPMILFLLLGFAYGDDELEGVKGSDYLLIGTLGYGVVATAFAGLTIVLVIRREDGILKRLRSTPLPAPVYLTRVAGYDDDRVPRPGRRASSWSEWPPSAPRSRATSSRSSSR